MQRAMLNWNGVPTHVITEGHWVEEGLSQYGIKDIAIVITGNPGIPEFYEGFIKTLRTRLSIETLIWVVGHAGHVQPPNNLLATMPNDSTWNEHYSLIAQLEHKKEFIKKYAPEDAKLHLIGHSIGCWIILNMLKDVLISRRVAKCYLLFPTIENIAETRNGWFFTRVVSRIASILIFLSWTLSCLPHFLQAFLISIYSLLNGIPAKYNKAIQQLLNPRSLRNVIKMADEEMEIVKERDDELLSKHADKLWFYYGNCDGWAPVRHYENMKLAHPNVNAELCKRGYHHCFVLQYDKEMGKIVGDLINESIS
ncbi:lipid droplet-associated hydrolase [Colletes gigas]|uniref:lipid droplet-associated hydrolase n=1 Tax=Colletes gigas TaxID=935657 RepID=UPI001C9A4293|nr:lipid droplet-associated hydrolase [Colletes gigas]XP_043261858.1 lipid droplet-associated hydrolase [Colletes gigas]